MITASPVSLFARGVPSNHAIFLVHGSVFVAYCHGTKMAL
jgi:hypothetical protein